MAAHRTRIASARRLSVASISSMTGFARVDGAHGDYSWSLELKSVNGRGLEIRFRLPPGSDELESILRRQVQRHLNRGSVNVVLTLQSVNATGRYVINKVLLEDVLSAIKSVKASIDCAPPQAENILALQGVMESVETVLSEAEQKELNDSLVESFAIVLDRLKKARRAEGVALYSALNHQLDEIDMLIERAKNLQAGSVKALGDKLLKQISEVLKNTQLSEERLAQEAALLAIKSDIREELDRLVSHVEACRKLLKSEGPIGRQLDFLTQEFNREANTLCSKAPDLELKQVGLHLKNVVDQMREQAQNVE